MHIVKMKRKEVPTNSKASMDIMDKEYQTVGGNDDRVFIQNSCQQSHEDQGDCQQQKM